MPYVTKDDDRVHLTTDDTKSLAKKIVDFARKEAVGDLNAPACNECLARAILSAYVTLAYEVAQTDHIGEMMGIALGTGKSIVVLREVESLLVKGVVAKDPLAMLEMVLGELKSTHP